MLRILLLRWVLNLDYISFMFIYHLETEPIFGLCQNKKKYTNPTHYHYKWITYSNSSGVHMASHQKCRYATSSWLARVFWRNMWNKWKKRWIERSLASSFVVERMNMRFEGKANSLFSNWSHASCHSKKY